MPRKGPHLRPFTTADVEALPASGHLVRGYGSTPGEHPMDGAGERVEGGIDIDVFVQIAGDRTLSRPG